ncbi:MaoC/PaaZ C-terminal domain-containing protein [Beijerinckia indica]|uniref:MaoC domain protein dehydratase n=1 Tax=Beijerinckia indica subsp. indica (strain ATCC 9039 / DSM 1715 / NCIMB 8712) TaxID=395963 RepID=B2ID84_BEII9|nr:MaoC/PaaZ C-terminal domain-containing protein [Beijerinckia indica]ACB93941.1 MaoC domain protein dehydratase [Beijerinckia indica subsp. indica ATCC 9039]
MSLDPGVSCPDFPWPKPGEILPPQALGPFDSSALSAYALASGDDNPLHLDPAAAHSIGLPLPPVQGMLILASFEPCLAAWNPQLRLSRLSAKFLRPVFLGQGLTLSGKIVRHRTEPEPEIVLRLMAHLAAPPASNDSKPGELAILAEANLIRNPSPHAS